MHDIISLFSQSFTKNLAFILINMYLSYLIYLKICSPQTPTFQSNNDCYFCLHCHALFLVYTSNWDVSWDRNRGSVTVFGREKGGEQACRAFILFSSSRSHASGWHVESRTPCTERMRSHEFTQTRSEVRKLKGCSGNSQSASHLGEVLKWLWVNWFGVRIKSYYMKNRARDNPAEFILASLSMWVPAG